VVRQYAANGDDWTTGEIHLWGACLQQGNDPQKAYARTWASQTPGVSAGLAVGPTVIAAPDDTASPLKIHGPGSNLADNTLLELTAGGELILAGGSGTGYRLAELMAATNPSGWSGVNQGQNPAGATLCYILLYSDPRRSLWASARARQRGQHLRRLHHAGQACPHPRRGESIELKHELHADQKRATCSPAVTVPAQAFTGR
jgi:hypothetical protein